MQFTRWEDGLVTELQVCQVCEELHTYQLYLPEVGEILEAEQRDKI